MRQYEELWKRIAAADKEIALSCAPSYAPRLIQAVKKEKSRANVLRKQLDMPRYGKLEISQRLRDDGKVLITFTLKYNGDKL